MNCPQIREFEPLGLKKSINAFSKVIFRRLKVLIRVSIYSFNYLNYLNYLSLCNSMKSNNNNKNPQEMVVKVVEVVKTPDKYAYSNPWPRKNHFHGGIYRSGRYLKVSLRVSTASLKPKSKKRREVTRGGLSPKLSCPQKNEGGQL